MSFITTRSASATVVEVAEVLPSMIVNSAVVAASPSKISSSASPITALPIVNPVAVTTPVEVIAPESIVPAKVTFAPLKVAAVVVPDLIIKLPLVLVKLP